MKKTQAALQPNHRRLIPGFDGALFSREWKDALSSRFFMAAPTTEDPPRPGFPFGQRLLEARQYRNSQQSRRRTGLAWPNFSQATSVQHRVEHVVQSPSAACWTNLGNALTQLNHLKSAIHVIDARLPYRVVAIPRRHHQRECIPVYGIQMPVHCCNHHTPYIAWTYIAAIKNDSIPQQDFFPALCRAVASSKAFCEFEAGDTASSTTVPLQ